MKKSEKQAIRRQVDKATDKHVPKVIDSYARGKAYDKVAEAMREDTDDSDGDDVSGVDMQQAVNAAVGTGAAMRSSPPMTPAMHAARITRKA